MGGGGGHEKKRGLSGGAMVIRNGGSKNSTSPLYLVKNERSLTKLHFKFDDGLFSILSLKTFVVAKLKIKER